MKIFIVEDEKNIRQELQLLLRPAMYEVAAAEYFDQVPAQHFYWTAYK